MTTLRSLAPLAVAAAALVGLAPAPARAEPPRAFFTSIYGPGELGAWSQAAGQEGLAAGDTICWTLAQAAGLAAPESFRAWLSDSTTDAWCHVQGLEGRRDDDCAGLAAADPPFGPWARLDGAPFAARLARLADPAHPEIYQTLLVEDPEHQLDWWSGDTWTGTAADGRAVRFQCSNWASSNGADRGAIGNAFHAGVLWTDIGDATCNSHKRLYCLAAAGGPLQQRAAGEGTIAFVTSVVGPGDLALWADAGGVAGTAGADAVCRARAAAADLPGAESFRAWLGDSTESAYAHVGDVGPLWRVDGVRFAESTAALLGALAQPLAPLHVDERCGYAAGAAAPREAWTGTTAIGTTGAACADWSSAAADTTGQSGRFLVRYTYRFTAWGANACDREQPLYCFSTLPLLFWDGFECGDVGKWSVRKP